MEGRKECEMMKFSKQVTQNRTVAGVPIPILRGGCADYDELLREAVRVALRTDTSDNDDFHELYDRIRELICCYLESTEGDYDPCILMTRLAACVADVIPMAMRKELITLATPQTQ
jgi:hypothetical protein